MLSLGRLTRDKEQRINVNPGEAGRSERRVLPRLLRRPVRIFNRFFSGRIAVTMRGCAVVGLVIAGCVGGWALANSSHGEALLAQLTIKAGFDIKGVRIDGAGKITKNAIVGSLNFEDTNSLVTFDVHKARLALRELAWVSDAVISKSFPDYLDIRIIESKPFAIWQDGQRLVLIERNGRVIDVYNDQYAHLPLMVGRGANRVGADIYSQIQRSKSLAPLVKAYIRVADRRWDLKLSNGIRIRLPDVNIIAALSRFDKFEENSKILARDLEIIDLRLDGQLVVRLRNDGVETDTQNSQQTVKSKAKIKSNVEKQT